MDAPTSNSSNTLPLSNVQILSKGDWETMFPKTLYQQYQKGTLNSAQAKDMRRHYLKFLIVHNSEALVIKHLKSRRLRPELISSASSEHGLTPLHIATMLGKFSLADALLEQGAKVQTRDGHGWTPLHHAALTSDKLYRLFVEHGADEEEKTWTEATCDDLRLLTQVKAPCESLHPLFFREKGGEIIKVSKEELAEKTGFCGYCDEVVYPPKHVKKLWMTEREEVGEKTLKHFLLPALRAGYRRIRKEQPKLVIGKSVTGLGLFAGEAIKKGSPITEYVGRVYDQPQVTFMDFFDGSVETERPYSFSDVDAGPLGNASRFINDGAPNAVIVGVPNERGRSERFLVCAKRDIEEGEEIFWDYGGGAAILKWGRYCLQGREALRAYFASNPPTKTLSIPTAVVLKGALDKLNNGESLTIEDNLDTNPYQNIVYAFATPFALMDLTLSGTVPACEWKAIRGHPVIRQLQQRHSGTNASQVLIQILSNFDKQLAQLSDTELPKDIRSFLLDQMPCLNAFQLAKGIDEVAKWLAATTSSDLLESTWESKKANLKETLPKYDWLKDEAWTLTKTMRLVQQLTQQGSEGFLKLSEAGL